MKKKMIFGSIIAFVSMAMIFTLASCSSSPAAVDYNRAFGYALDYNNIQRIEELLESGSRQMDLTACLYYTLTSETHHKGFNKANCLDVVKLLVRYGADANKPFTWTVRSASNSVSGDWGYPLENAVSEKQSIAVIQFLLDSGANPNYASRHGVGTPPVRQAYSNKDMPVVNLLLDRGANGAVILPSASERGDNEIIRQLISRGVQIRSDQGAEALRWAAYAGKLDTIKLLVENGVNVNARSNNNNKYIQEHIPLGATAASIAYDKGEMEIYDYLKANGARDFEPRQAAQPAAPAPANTTVYVQPSVPAQATPSEPERNVGKEIADAVSNAFQPPLDNGTYRMSGGAEQIVFAGIARGGNISYKDAAGTTHRGTYSIDGTRLTINVMGRSYFYTITSKTSFSGNGESWFRVGF